MALVASVIATVNVKNASVTGLVGIVLIIVIAWVFE